MLSALWDLLFPLRCLFCGERLEADTILCTHCRGQVLEVSRCCPLCGYPVVKQSERECPRCNGQKFMFDRACAVGLYEGKLKAVIRRYKYGGRTEMAAALGKLMAQQIEKCKWPQFAAVVPIPLHPRKQRQRGFDQAVLLAEAIGRQLKVPVKKYLRRSRETVSQTQLSAAQRRHNLAGAFTVVQAEQIPKRILLVDDLLTTGATADNAARALLAGGAEEIYLAVIGRSLPS
ncbi:MAG: ComF family protein [Firmicutes bacterium]|nr:ComF family protein [Bacillota bacterium]